jgi:hypothetical protein
MAKINENQEVITHICMSIDNYDKAHQFKDIDEEEVLNDDELQKSDVDQRHWSLGAPEKITTAKNLEQCFQQMSIMLNSPIFKHCLKIGAEIIFAKTCLRRLCPHGRIPKGLSILRSSI